MTRLSVTKKGEWLTNHPKSIRDYWPRRAIRIHEGRTPDQRYADAIRVLQNRYLEVDRSLVGIWLDQDLVAPPIFYPLCKDQKTYEAELKRLEDPEELKQIQVAWELYQAAEAYAASWRCQGRIETIVGRELCINDTVEALAVTHPLEGEAPGHVDDYIEEARQILDEPTPNSPSQT